MAKKNEETPVKKVKAFYFPQENVSVEADTYEDALVTLAKLTKDKEDK